MKKDPYVYIDDIYAALNGHNKGNALILSDRILVLPAAGLNEYSALTPADNYLPDTKWTYSGFETDAPSGDDDG